jgi:hypothetical protein
VELSPAMSNRLANSSLGAVPAATAVAYAAQAGTGFSRLTACFAVIGFAILAVRGYRLGVTCERGRLSIRGYLHTRVITRECITEITDFPAVRWTPRTGSKRWTPITAFMTSPSEASATRLHKAHATRKLRRWAGR